MNLLKRQLRKVALQLEWSLWPDAPKSTWGTLTLMDRSAECEENSGQNLQTLERALDFIAEYDYRAIRRIQTGIRRIIVTDLVACSGVFRREWGAAVVSSDLVRSGRHRDVAVVIIHEGTHGYLEHRGIRYDEEQRTRIERICFRSEAAFLRKVPGNEDLVQRILERPGPAPRTRVELKINAMEEAVQRLERLKAPTWILRVCRHRVERLHIARAEPNNGLQGTDPRA